jgi:TPR repeat protein
MIECRIFRRIGCLLAVVSFVGPGTGHAAESSSNAPTPPLNTVSDASALYARAIQYAKGDGVDQDRQKAAECMRKSAELGYAVAQNDLGVYYAKGLGVPQDYIEAAKWYRKAAENGDPLGQYSMGRCCLEGRGVSSNVVESLKWFKMAAAQEQPDALLALGYLYMESHQDLPADWKEARQWFQKAVDQGKFGALNPIGFMYERGGLGIDQDLNKAIQTYRDAAEKNEPEGQMNVGRMYYEGLGVRADYQEAYKWFYVAHSNGSGLANHYLLELEGQNPAHGAALTREQIQKAIQEAVQIQQRLVKSARKPK